MTQEVYLIRVGAGDLAQAPLWWPWVLSFLLGGIGLVFWAMGRPLARAILLGAVTTGLAVGAWTAAVMVNPDRPAVLFLLVGAALGGLVSGLFARAVMSVIAGSLLAMLALGWTAAVMPGSGPDPMQSLEQGRAEYAASIRKVPVSDVEEARQGREGMAPPRPLINSLVESIRVTTAGFEQGWQGRSEKAKGLLLLLPLAAFAAGILLVQFRPHWVAAPLSSLLGAGLVLQVLWAWGLGRPKLWLWMAAWTFLGTLGLFFQARLVGYSDPAPQTNEAAIEPK